MTFYFINNSEFLILLYLLIFYKVILHLAESEDPTMEQTISTVVNEPRKTFPSHRLSAIDFVRGFAIILMALDHASTYWNKGRVFGEGIIYFEFYPLSADLLQILVRFVTHYCAPTFIFLAGTSIALSEAKRLEKGEKSEIFTQHLVIRGLILLVIEWTVIAFMFQAAPLYFGVLACIGFSFIILAIIRELDTLILFILSIGIIALSPFLYYNLTLSGAFDSLNFLKIVLFSPEWPYGIYPLIPWFGVMGLGFVFGRWLKKQQTYPDTTKRIVKMLAIVGIGSIGAFFILRIATGFPFNYLGIWDMEEPLALKSLLLISKYPPSITYLLWTLGGMCLVLAIAFKLQESSWFKSWSFPVVLFGTTPLFFYSIHLLIYGPIPVLFDLKNGFPLQITLMVWILGLILLYPLCLYFRETKKKYPHSVLKYI